MGGLGIGHLNFFIFHLYSSPSKMYCFRQDTRDHTFKIEDRLPFRNLMGTKGDQEGICQDGLHQTVMTNSLELLVVINTAFTSCPHSLSNPVLQKNLAHQSLGDPADRAFLLVCVSPSPQQSSVANWTLARANVLPLAKLVTWSHLTSGRQGHTVLL